MVEPDGTIERLAEALSGRYRIQREVGAGGMATVYLAEDLMHDRQVAIKVMRPELAASLGAERFLREIQISAKLNHPHILTLIDSGEVGGILYYVMPFVAGESLRDRLDREDQLPLGEALEIAREVADALGYAHRLDVVHRDIKPGNVLLSEGHAIVTDFVANVLARAALPDSARHVLESVRAATTGEIDPDGALLFLEAHVRAVLGDYEQAVELLRSLKASGALGEDDDSWADYWYWDDLREHPGFRELTGS